MRAASPVVPGLPDQPDMCEVMFGAGQEGVEPLPALRVRTKEGHVITRWELAPEDLARLNAGGSVYIWIETCWEPLQPVHVTTEPPQLYVRGAVGDTAA